MNTTSHLSLEYQKYHISCLTPVFKICHCLLYCSFYLLKRIFQRLNFSFFLFFLYIFFACIDLVSKKLYGIGHTTNISSQWFKGDKWHPQIQGAASNSLPRHIPRVLNTVDNNTLTFIQTMHFNFGWSTTMICAVSCVLN